MNKSVFVALTAAIALCGCHRNDSNQQGTTATAANDSLGTPVTLVGCLVPGGAEPQSGTVGTSGTTAPATFTLIDVTTTSNSANSAAEGTTGTAGSGATVATTIPRSYQLVNASNRGDLQNYQNSKVEVTGRIVASTDTGAGVPDVGAASAPAGAPPTDVQRVRVDHVKQLDKTCSGPSR